MNTNVKTNSKIKIKDANSPCPCQSGAKLSNCCGVYIYTQVNAPDAVALMRSRYTANVKKAYKYLANTWHADNKPSKITMNGKTNWLGLEIVDSTLQSDKAWVEFKAFYGHQDHQHALHEKSFFVLENDQWWYVEGEIMSQVHCGHNH